MVPVCACAPQRSGSVQSPQTVDRSAEVPDAPALNPNRELITGVICGVRVEEIEEPIMREIRYLDKVIDELSRGKKMESILRTP